MKKTKNLLKGKKISNKHQTYSSEVAFVIGEIKSNDLVTKIVLSQIKPIKNGKKRLKIKQVDAGLEINVRGSVLMQKIYIYTTDPLGISDILSDSFKKKFG